MILSRRDCGGTDSIISCDSQRLHAISIEQPPVTPRIIFLLRIVSRAIINLNSKHLIFEEEIHKYVAIPTQENLLNLILDAVPVEQLGERHLRARPIHQTLPMARNGVRHHLCIGTLATIGLEGVVAMAFEHGSCGDALPAPLQRLSRFWLPLWFRE